MGLIDRQAAIDVFRKLADDEWNKHTGASWADGYESAIEILEEIPSAQERKPGKWEKSYADHEAFGVRPFFRYCSECREATVHKYNFCPNCGADMRGEEDEPMD